MTLLKRRTPREHTGGVAAGRPSGSIAVAAWEYVEVDDTALVRATGTWNAGGDDPVDVTLSVSRADDEAQTFPALANAPSGTTAGPPEGTWQAAFAVPIGLVESPLSRFRLHADRDTIDLSPPERYVPSPGGERAPAAAETGDEIDPEGRVRQAEAAIDWMQRQLAREREVRRTAEETLAAARPEIEARRRELEHVAALEREAAHLAEARQRNDALEGQVSELSARVRELSHEHDFYEQLQREVTELTTERDRLLALEPVVADLTSEKEAFTAERDELRAERDLLTARIGELTGQLEHITEERDRLAPLEARVQDLSVQVDELQAGADRLAELEAKATEVEAKAAELEAKAADLDDERERRLALEAQLADVAVERERLQALQAEANELRAENEELSEKSQRLPELERERDALAALADRVEGLEERLSAVTAERDRLKSIESEAAAAVHERERRRELEDQLSSQAVDHERVDALEQWVGDLRRALAEARDELLASENARRDLRAELSRVRAAAAEMEAKLRVHSGDDEGVAVASDADSTAPGADETSAIGRMDSEDGEDTNILTFDVEPDEPAAGGEAVSCSACDALGSCPRCGGRGKRFGRRCSECNGSGTCSVCGGPGYVWVGQAVGRSQ